MKKIIFILPIFLMVFFCQGQEILTPKPQAKFITGFPFQQFTGGIILVQALLNDIPDTLNFILDTGCGGISLDSATCSKYNVKQQPTDTTITGMGAAHKVNFAFNQTLHLPGLTINGLNFHINDYAILSSVYGQKIDGLIGYSFFSRYIVNINFDSSWIKVYSPGEIKYPKEGTLLHPVFNSLPTETIEVKDARKINFNFYFDLGAGLCFLMSRDFAKDSSIVLSRRRQVVTEAQGMGGRLQMNLTVIKQLKIGSYKFRNVPTYIFDDEYNVTNYPFIGGLIGDDLLRHFNLTINYPNNEIHLLPNSHYTDSFDYAYTGLIVFFIDGRIMVDDVIKGSPAQKAGIKKGDVLVAVAGNTSNNIQQYKILLQATDEKIRLLINRDGILHQLYITPVSIL
jgi:hypothetical protein